MLKECFTYDPKTGLMVRNKTTSHNAKAGDIVGCENKSGYMVVNYQGKVQYLHRLIWEYMTGEKPQGHIDHINGNRVDNRWENLRDVTQKVNMQNIRKATSSSSTGLLGAFKAKDSKKNPYRAGIQVDGKLKMLGHFPTAEQAHQVYLKAKQIYHEGCTLNA